MCVGRVVRFASALGHHERRFAVNAEQRVISALEREFGQRFQELKLSAGKRFDGSAADKRFDAVSEDRKVVAMVKECKGDSVKNENGNQTRKVRVNSDMHYLSLVNVDKKLMYLSPDYHRWFVCQKDAAIPPGIELREIPK